MDEIKKLLLDARDNLEWIMGRPEWDSLSEGSSAGSTVEEIDRIFGKSENYK
tara:strand:+ start:582 stop:737 length:156 start_codon:yes stop_codon:yes gene_type:complete